MAAGEQTAKQKLKIKKKKKLTLDATRLRQKQ